MDEFKSFDPKLYKIYLVFTNFNHLFSIENHFMELRKSNKAKVNTTRPQVSLIISDLRLHIHQIKESLLKLYTLSPNKANKSVFIPKQEAFM